MSELKGDHWVSRIWHLILFMEFYEFMMMTFTETFVIPISFGPTLKKFQPWNQFPFAIFPDMKRKKSFPDSLKADYPAIVIFVFQTVNIDSLYISKGTSTFEIFIHL